MEQWLVGVDLGGTTIKLAFVTIDGEIVCKWEIPTNTKENGIHITSDIATAISSKLQELSHEKNKVAGIGIGAPGFIEMETGFVYKAINIGWEDFELKTILEKETGLPVIVDNDANIAAIGEMWKGAGEGAKDLICITLGTGVGGGIITNGEIVHGINGMAGEIGHIKVIPEGGPPCNCGGSGCLETVSSAKGMVKLAMNNIQRHPTSLLNKKLDQSGFLSTKMIFDCAVTGDPFANEVIEEACYYLGLAIANMSNMMNPEKIVIGGGVSKASDHLLKPITKYFKQFALPRVFEGANLSIAELGNDAGVIGGAWLVKNKRII